VEDAEPLTDALNELGIPYSLQKQSGFWQSDEVRHLETLLTCLSRPEERSAFRKALLTCFFRIRPDELVRNQDLPQSHPARRLYRKWLEQAEARQWSALFHSLLEETGLLLQAMGRCRRGDAPGRPAPLDGHARTCRPRREPGPARADRLDSRPAPPR